MNIDEIVTQLDAEIARLQAAKDALLGNTRIKRKYTRRATTAAATTPTGRTRRTMSAAARKRISAAMKARWAARKKVS